MVTADPPSLRDAFTVASAYQLGRASPRPTGRSIRPSGTQKTRAKAELQQTDAALTAAAVDAVDGLAKRDPSLSPDLHLALCVWALDRLVPDRDEAPWPQLRQRFGRGEGFGVDQPIRRYGAAIAAAPFDAAGVTQALLGEVGSSPSPTDSVVLIWLLTATLERVVEALPESDSGLRVLVEQRAGLVERLIDYLYVSFTNAAAFSPTDTMPLSRWAKMLMLAQSAMSLSLAVMVVARAVNILR